MSKIRRKRNNLKMSGYFFMILGLLLPLYSFTSLMLSNYNAQKEYRKFSSSVDSAKVEKKDEFGLFVDDYEKKLNKNFSGIVDPFSNENYKAEYNFRNGLDKDGVYFYLKIPKIDIVKPVVLDASAEHLAKSLAHVNGTDLPVGGKNFRSVIAGHRGSYTDVFFMNLHKLGKGDEVRVENLKGEKLIYKVVKSEIIKPYEWEKLKPIENKDMLTLLTCDPISPISPYRLIVDCERVYEDNKIDNVKIDSGVKTINRTIYIVTIFGWLVLIFVIYKFYKYIKETGFIEE